MFCPNVLTNSYADFFAVDFKRLDAVCRLEIAIFIENIVGRQKGLVRFTDRFPPLEQRRRVAKRFAPSFVAINEPDKQRRVSDSSVQFLQDCKILRNEPRLKNQVLRWISRNRQLRSQHQFRAHGSKTLISADDEFTIPAQISHGGVNLSKTDLHAALRQVKCKIVGSKPRPICHSLRARW